MSNYNPRAYNIWGLVAGLIVGALLAPFIWIVNLFHPSANAQLAGGSMQIENVVFLVMLVITLAALAVLTLNNFRLANLIPVTLVRDLIRAAVDTALAAGQRYAETTVTTADDEIIALIQEEVAKLFAAQAQTVKAEQREAVRSEVAKQIQTLPTTEDLGHG